MLVAIIQSIAGSRQLQQTNKNVVIPVALPQFAIVIATVLAQIVSNSLKHYIKQPIFKAN